VKCAWTIHQKRNDGKCRWPSCRRREGPEEGQLRHDLSEYCSMDTLAMMAVLVKIWSRASVTS